MTDATAQNPFETAERWEVSTDTMLPVGNHIVTIVRAEGSTTRTSSNPQIELKFENSQGSLQDWLVYNEKLLGKVSSLFEAAGVQLPQPGEFDQADKYRLSDACISRLMGKTVGIVVRTEQDTRDPMNPKVKTRIAGYVTVDRIKQSGSDIPADTAGLPTSGMASTASSAAAEDIPF